MTGPTTTGSIDAKLTVDDSDFKRGMAEAKAEAKEVGALEPTVKVDANVGEALAKLDAVTAAEKRLEAAQRAKLNTSGALSLAEMRYEAVMTKSGRTDLQVAAAEEALARARRADMVATEKSTAATEMLNVAKSTAAKKALEEAAADDVANESSKRAVQTNNQRVSGIGVLIAMAPAILAASAPIAGAAVGLGAAFGVMGVSGVLAIKGIKDAMEVGDTAGNTYAAGISIVKDNLNQLAGTAATGMLQSFSRVVYDLNTDMPFLNTITGQFAGQLGQIGGTALRGVLDGLRTMNPLLQAGGVELSKFVTWLFSFNNTTGFNQFVQYATANLPAVMHLIESLVTLAGHLMSAFAPLGPVLIGALSMLADLLNSFPLPVIAGIATAATAIAPAMKIAGAAIELFSIQTQLSIPVIGIVTAALTGIGIAVATAALSTDQGTQSFQDYTQALKEDNDVLGEHVRLQAAKALSDAGAYDAARTLGVSQTTLTNALMGVAGAQDIVNEAIKRGKEFQRDTSQGYLDTTSNVYAASDAQNKMGKAIDTVTKTLDTQRTSMDRGKQINEDMAVATNSQTAALQAQAAQYGVTVDQYKSAQDAQDKTGQTTADTTAKMRLQNDAAGLLKMAWDELNGKTISAAQAQNAFDSSLANMGDHVDKVGKKITFTTTSITDMSAASVALRGQLIGQVTSMEKVIEADGGLQNATAQSKAKYAEMREQIIDNAVAHGVNRDAAVAYIDSIYKIPTAVTTTVDVNKSAAEQKIADLQWRLDQLQTHKRIFIEVSRSDSVNTGLGDAKGSDKVRYDAAGGMVNYLASGGAPAFVPKGTDTVPAMLTPGEVVINRASVQALGAANLLHANKTGQWPGQSGQGQSGVHIDHLEINEQQDPNATVMAFTRRMRLLST